MLWQDIEHAISSALQTSFTVDQRSSIGGGCINKAYKISGGKIEKRQHVFFVKTNHADLIGMFEAEIAGLEEIQASKSIRTPKPVTAGISNETAYIVLEHFKMCGSHINDVLFGQQLAVMHKHTNSRFGWFRQNTIGQTYQDNSQLHDWPRFWRQHRLGYQLNLAARNGYLGRLQTGGEKLMTSIPLFFSSYQPAPSLVHGDLWSGNYSSLDDGTPVIFDPAVYYGDRETDLAMTELFGGFSSRFYAAYKEASPLEPGYVVRKNLYNLYHILNHLNLFGGGYLSQAESMIDSLLAEVS